jgi:hypothetical protein
MSEREIMQHQYRASLVMLEQAIAKCPDSLWYDPEPKNRYWHLAYHVLFYAHLYLHDSPETFRPWSKHRNEYQFLGPLPWPPHKEPEIGDPYHRDEVLEYLALCRRAIDEEVPKLDLNARSGFPWLPFDKMELQFYNIRHMQHHIGQLIDRLRSRANISVDWVGTME